MTGLNRGNVCRLGDFAPYSGVRAQKVLPALCAWTSISLDVCTSISRVLTTVMALGLLPARIVCRGLEVTASLNRADATDLGPRLQFFSRASWYVSLCQYIPRVRRISRECSACPSAAHPPHIRCRLERPGRGSGLMPRSTSAARMVASGMARLFAPAEVWLYALSPCGILPAMKQFYMERQ